MPSLKNRDVFYRDPLASRIPNDGVARVVTPDDAKAWDVLRFELQTFVCDGEYARGLERVLATFIDNLAQAQQPAAWVSGFYGSGKSHFARVLEHLWRDVTFPDGTRARSLVSVPKDIQGLLIELTRLGRQEGGLWSAAGTLGAGTGAVRLGLLSIIFRSAGLPEQYAAGRLVLWLRQNGWLSAVETSLASQGRTLRNELHNLYVSPYLHAAICAAVPSLGSAADIRALLRQQYPTVQDISDADLLATMADVLALQSTTPCKTPLTLLVFDELQQFIAEDPTRTLHVQNVIEACTSRFGSRLLVVATGQSALQATPQLSKLQGRFSVRVTLSDADVEKVVREVVLRKAEDKKADVQRSLDSASGEIDRHLDGTKIGPHAEDDRDRVPDYPLLPVRRRFWERALRAIDAPGVEGQLRTQLRLVHEAVREVAERPLGFVVGGDAVYWQQEGVMLQSSVLDRDLATTIKQLDDNTAEGRLRARLCALVFLINRLPTDGPLATGLQATADALADLLVEDLTVSSAPLRGRVATALQALVDQATLMKVGDEYRLQTRESSEWEREFSNRFSRIFADDSRVAGDRATAIRTAISTALKGVSLVQGKSKVNRKLDYHFGQEPPPLTTGNVPVWIRDEWAVSEKAVRDEAQAAGTDSPVVYVFIPRRDADELKRAIARAGAADETVKTKPMPQTEAGRHARQAMESRATAETDRMNGLVAGIVKAGRVYQGGGNEIAGDEFADRVKEAADAALVRLFPKFNIVDQVGWDKVVTRARQGSGDALTNVGYSDDTDKHPACQEVRTYVGGAGRKGADVRRHFTGTPYGWPQDAVDGSLLALLAAGHLRAMLNGQPLRDTRPNQQQLGVTDFFSEGVTITRGQLMDLRTLALGMGFPVKTEDVEAAIPRLLDRLVEVAERAGGEPPRPERPDIAPIRTLQESAGKQQVANVHAMKDLLTGWYTTWTKTADLIQQKLPGWERLETLLRHASGLPEAATVRPQADAIRANRSLLDTPDPVPPLIAQVAASLRSAVQDTHTKLQTQRDDGVRSLEASAEWARLTADQQQQLSTKYELQPIPSLDVGTDEALIAALDRTSLSAREDRIAAVRNRVSQARAEAAKMLEPKAVSMRPPSATLKTVPEVNAYVDKLRADLLALVGADTPVIIQS